MPLRRLCKKVGCKNYALEGHKYCENHLYIEEEKSKPDYSKFSRSTLYLCKKWRDASRAFLLKNQTCCMCGAKATITDHIIPHRGNEDLFWDENNWQPLCKSCHDQKTMREIRSRIKMK